MYFPISISFLNEYGRHEHDSYFTGCSDQNEEITNCPAPCDETCSGPPPVNCRLSPCAQKGCRCKTGFVRDSSGVCIPKNQCRKLI